MHKTIVEIKQEIKNFENKFEFDISNLINNIDKILYQNKQNNQLYDYKIVCDENIKKYEDTDKIKINIMLQPTHATCSIFNTFTIIPNKIKVLRELRKKKLEKLDES